MLLKNLTNGSYYFYIQAKNKAGWGCAEQAGYPFTVNNPSAGSFNKKFVNTSGIDFFIKNKKLFLFSSKNDYIEIELLNLQGKILFKENLSLINGRMSALNIENIKSGLYLLSVKGSKEYNHTIAIY